jgi:hypothetical protein
MHTIHGIYLEESPCLIHHSFSGVAVKLRVAIYDAALCLSGESSELFHIARCPGVLLRVRGIVQLRPHWPRIIFVPITLLQCALFGTGVFRGGLFDKGLGVN